MTTTSLSGTRLSVGDKYECSCGSQYSTRSRAGKFEWSAKSCNQATTIFVCDWQLCVRCFTSTDPVSNIGCFRAGFPKSKVIY